MRGDGKSYQFVASTAPRLVNGLPDGALFKDGPVTITFGGASKPLTYVGHVYKALLDEGMRLNQVPCFGSRDFLVPGLLAGVFSVGGVDDGAVR